MQKNIPLITSGTLFFLLALLQLYRMVHPFDITVGFYLVPLWINAIAFLVLGLLSLWMFYSLREN